MSCTRPLYLRHLATQPVNLQKGLQRRWARVLDVRFLTTQHAQDRIAERYKEKLHEKARREGLKDVRELKEAYSDKISRMRKQAIVPGATGPLDQTDASPLSNRSPWHAPPPPPPAPQQSDAPPSSKAHRTSPSSSASTSSTSSSPGLKTLSSFIDVEKTRVLPRREIESLWRLRHAGNEQSLCAAIPTTTFSAIASMARKHPQFILPGLPRKQQAQSQSQGGIIPDSGAEETQAEGAPIHFLQWTFPAPDTMTVILTHLAEYKLRGEYTQPHTTMTHHLELAQSNGLVLCQGSVVPGRGVSVEEGKWLIMCLQKFYNTSASSSSSGSDGSSDTFLEPEKNQDQRRQGDGSVLKELRKARTRLMEQFSSGDANFRIEELLDQAERLG